MATAVIGAGTHLYGKPQSLAFRLAHFVEHGPDFGDVVGEQAGALQIPVRMKQRGIPQEVQQQSIGVVVLDDFAKDVHHVGAHFRQLVIEHRPEEPPPMLFSHQPIRMLLVKLRAVDQAGAHPDAGPKLHAGVMQGLFHDLADIDPGIHELMSFTGMRIGDL